MLNTRHEIEITALANSGDGVGRIDGRVIFVPYSCPGDKLLVTINKVQKNFLNGQITKILQPSVDRQTAECSYFTNCGGCDWQHVKYRKQLEWKVHNLKDVLKKIAKLPSPPLSPIIASPLELNYRNRIQVEYDKNSFYMHRKGSHQLIAIDHCSIADEEINKAMKSIHAKLLQSHKKGRTELSVGPEGVEFFPANKRSETDFGFRQVNDSQNRQLKEKILHLARGIELNQVIDLYCGQGNWALALAEEFPQLSVIGIDSNPANIKKAMETAQHLPSPPDFLMGKVESLYQAQLSHPSLVIIDPPRAGCSQPLLSKLKEFPPSWLIYISCHPATMARDLLSLQESFEIMEIQPVDMFPQTAHLECLSILRSAE